MNENNNNDDRMTLIYAMNAASNAKQPGISTIIYEHMTSSLSSVKTVVKSFLEENNMMIT